MFADEYVIITVDVEEMTDGQKVADELISGREGGFPWFAILDADGKELVASNDASGTNIGAPIGPDGRKHFVSMFAATLQRAPEERAQQIDDALAAFAEKFD